MGRKRKLAWAEEAKDYAWERWQAGASASEIAAELGAMGCKVSRNAVLGYIYRKQVKARGGPIRLPGPVDCMPKGCVAA